MQFVCLHGNLYTNSNNKQQQNEQFQRNYESSVLLCPSSGLATITHSRVIEISTKIQQIPI